MDKVVKARRAPPSARIWAVWAVLAAACYGSFAWVLLGTDSPLVSFVQAPWMIYWDMVIAPYAGIAALILPLVTLGALCLRRFYTPALAGMAFCAVILFLYVGLKAYWLANPAPFPYPPQP